MKERFHRNMFSLRFLIVCCCINEQLAKVHTIDATSSNCSMENDNLLLIQIEINLRNVSDSELVTRTPLTEKHRDIVLVDHTSKELQRGRHKSHKSHRYKKLHKFVIPVLMGVLAAKLILIPVLLKLLTAISTSALVLSKIALVTTGFLALKWLFGGSVKDSTRFDLIYLPQSGAAPFRIPGGSFTLANDQAWDASEVVDLQPYKNTEHKYIPMIVKDGTKYSSYGSGDGTKDSYAHTTYYGETNLYNGKPFL